MKTRYRLASVPLLLLSSSCSLFFELNANQCDVTEDCAHLGSAFANTTCENHVCVEKSAPGSAGAGGTDEDGGSGGRGSGGSSGKAGAGAVGGGDAGDGGAAGEGTGGPECTTNGDCISEHLDQPYVCVDGSCIALTSDDCPQLVPSTNTLDLLRTPAPIIVGAYANMNNTMDFHDSQAVINWDLAFSEFNTQTLGGIPNKSGGAARPVLALVCQSSTVADITPSLRHLTEELHVPAVLSTLSADRLLTAFNFTQAPEYAEAGGNPVLFLSTGSADLRLANLADSGLVWHMLGDPRTLAATAVGLLNRIIPTVEAAPGFTGPLRVTLVYSDDTTMSDLFSVLTTPDDAHPETLLKFNNKPAIDQLGSGEFRQVKIQSAKTHTTPVVQNAIDDLNDHPPHIVIGMATNEFGGIINAVESYAKAHDNHPPFYLASHSLYNTPELQGAVSLNANKTPPLSQRLVGVNYAETQDSKSKSLYDAYLARLKGSYSGSLTVAGTENHYDGAYSLLYSLAAAYAIGTKAPTGDIVSVQLDTRVFSTSKDAQSVDIGPAALGSNSVGKLSGLTYKMSLYGTMGPPNFDRTSGTRVTTTSAWCIEKSGTAFVYRADGLIYDPDAHEFSAPAAPAVVPACLSEY
ncbi:MAG: hypothetical protein WDO74_19125 [Pseudomonadota bacterium]